MNSFEDIKTQSFFKKLEKHGEVFFVGGSVRDKLLKKESKDIDLLVRKIPFDELIDLLAPFGKVDYVGESFGVIKLTLPIDSPGKGLDIDIALPRSERKMNSEEKEEWKEKHGKYPSGYQAFITESNPNLSLREDLERRDFTINAIAQDSEGYYYDFFNGLNDLEHKTIRMVNPLAFRDDPLRMARAIQFASRFDFTIQEETFLEIKKNANKIKTIPGERILIELEKIVYKGIATKGIELLDKTGLYQAIFERNFSGDIDRFSHIQTLGEFIYLMLEPFDNPEEIFMKKLKGDDTTAKEIRALKKAHRWHCKTLNEARYVVYKMNKISPNSLNAKIVPTIIKEAIKDLQSSKYPLTLKELAINGNDLIELEVKGKTIGNILNAALICVYDDHLKNKPKDLLEFAFIYKETLVS